MAQHYIRFNNLDTFGIGLLFRYFLKYWMLSLISLLLVHLERKHLRDKMFIEHLWNGEW